jgi:hypothetical protein
MMEQAVRTLFALYEQFVRQALAGDLAPDAVARLYAPEFIAASSAGVRAGRNDAQFLRALAEGHARYRQIGTRQMRISGIAISPIDDHHCVVRVGWTATYARDDLPETVLAFDVTYLVQVLEGTARVFGWVTGDEEALLKQHHII